MKNLQDHPESINTIPGANESRSFMFDTLTKKIEKVNIRQRRYLGCKAGVLDLIEKVVEENIGEYESFIDIFAGTGVVGAHFNKPSAKIISNDLLISNYYSLNCWLSFDPYDYNKIVDYINELNSLSVDEDNYAAEHFGNKYFSMANARKIGAIRDKIEKYKLNRKEKSILLTSLLYAIDKVANTCGHYDAYRRKMDSFKLIELKLPNIDDDLNQGNEIYNEDGNVLINRIEGDILYIDPPYNSRQYSDCYHVLDNIAMWTRPSVYGVARKYNRKAFKSRYNTRGAYQAFEDLIKNARVKNILFSYNNMGRKGDNRSNAVLSDEFILYVLRKKGATKVFEKDHNQFTAGKSVIDNHTERVFWCEVRK